MCPALPPQLLQPLFSFLKEIKAAGVKIFGNGAGKLLAFHLLQLLPFAPSVRIATTTDPRYNWCGIDGAHITGVVDVVVIIRGEWQVVGELQGNDTTGMMQLVAALHAVAERTGEWPCGELVLGGISLQSQLLSLKTRQKMIIILCA